MACFFVPAGEAIVTSIVQKVIENKEKKTGVKEDKETGIKWSRRLSWLNKMLWGGVILLALEHVWHGEIVPWPPFLTAMENPANIAPMLYEMATIGVAMAVVITLLWGIMITVIELKNRPIPQIKGTPAGGGE